MFGWPTRGQSGPNFWDVMLKAYVDNGGTSHDLGLVSATVDITAPGTYEFDITGDTAVTANITGDVTMWVHGTGTVTVAGQDFTVDGDSVILLVTSPRGVQSAHAVGAGSTPTPPEVIDSPTRPGASSVESTTSSLIVTVVPSTVAAGYEWDIDGGGYVDHGASPTYEFTGLVAGSTHSGLVRAYNSLGEKSTARSWGPADVTLPGLHEQLLAYDAPFYMNFTNGEIEDFSSVNRVWNYDVFGSGTTPVVDGPAIGSNGTTSLHLPAGNAWRSTTREGIIPFENQPVFSACSLFLDQVGVQFLGIVGAARGSVGNELLSPDNTIPHLVVWTWEDGVGGKVYRDGVQIAFQEFNWGNQLDTADFDNKGIWIGALNKSYSGAPSTSRIGHGLLWMAPILLSAEEAFALADAAGTVGNPR